MRAYRHGAEVVAEVGANAELSVVVGAEGPNGAVGGEGERVVFAAREFGDAAQRGYRGRRRHGLRGGAEAELAEAVRAPAPGGAVGGCRERGQIAGADRGNAGDPTLDEAGLVGRLEPRVGFPRLRACSPEPPQHNEANSHTESAPEPIFFTPHARTSAALPSIGWVFAVVGMGRSAYSSLLPRAAALGTQPTRACGFLALAASRGDGAGPFGSSASFAAGCQSGAFAPAKRGDTW